MYSSLQCTKYKGSGMVQMKAKFVHNTFKALFTSRDGESDPLQVSMVIFKWYIFQHFSFYPSAYEVLSYHLPSVKSWL